jgi:hypothetical protein
MTNARFPGHPFPGIDLSRVQQFGSFEGGPQPIECVNEHLGRPMEDCR